MRDGPCEPPVVSIVINNYNYGRFLQECIDSALRQTYTRSEVIVVDDGSTDNSREIIASYRDRVLPVLKENGGQASAFNAGFAASRGEIVIFLDADDLLLPEAAERVARAWRPRLAKAQYKLRIIDAFGRSQERLIPSGPMPSGDIRNLVLSSVVHNGPPTSGNAFSRRVLDQILPIPEREWRISADGYLLSLSPFLGSVASLHEVLGLYRVHDSNNYTMGELDLRKLREILVQDVRKQDLVRSFGERMGLAVDRDPILRSPGHVKARLASRRLAADRHPFPQDRTYSLVARGIRAYARARDTSLRNRLLLSVWLILVAVLPRAVVEPLISLGLIPQERRRLLASMFTRFHDFSSKLLEKGE